MVPQREQRLVTRFALGSLIAFVAIGLALPVTISRQLRSRGEDQAEGHAAFVTEAILRYELTQADLTHPVRVSSRRYRELARFVRDRIIDVAGGSQFEVVRVKVWAPDGTVLFSDEPRLVGRRFEVDDDLVDGFNGKLHAGISDLKAKENVFERTLASKLFETYVPLYLHPAAHRRPDAVVELYQDYAAIHREITAGFRTIATGLLIGLATLYILLLPIAFRTSRRVGEQNARLAEQARKLEELLAHEQNTVAELRELNRLKSNFVAVASHELRTPLTSIIGYAKTLRQPQFADDQGTRQEFVEAIERQGDRLFQLVENLLTASRLEGESLKASVTAFSFGELTKEVVEGLGSQGERVLVSLPPDMPTMITDRQYVAQILQNLLSNALKFSPADVPCELGAGHGLDWIAFWVRDQGIGIPSNEVGRIFERFYQVDSSSTRRYGGIGLGLSLVQSLVQTLGGRIEVQSRVKEGSTFTVMLPLTQPSTAAGSSSPLPPPPALPLEPLALPGTAEGGASKSRAPTSDGAARAYSHAPSLTSPDAPSPPEQDPSPAAWPAASP